MIESARFILNMITDSDISYTLIVQRKALLILNFDNKANSFTKILSLIKNELIIKLYKLCDRTIISRDDNNNWILGRDDNKPDLNWVIFIIYDELENNTMENRIQLEDYGALRSKSHHNRGKSAVDMFNKFLDFQFPGQQKVYDNIPSDKHCIIMYSKNDI